METKIFERNWAGIDFIVGDIHGCFEQLNKILNRKQFDPKVDRVFSVGDLVDRGSQSELSLEYISKPWFHPVLGNHEKMAIMYFHGLINEDIYIYNGGEWFVKLDQIKQYEFVQAFQELPYLIEVSSTRGKVGIVHAECPLDDWEELKHCEDESIKQKCIWGRDVVRGEADGNVRNVDIIFSGHTVVNKPVMVGNHCFIDTGAVFERYLTIFTV